MSCNKIRSTATAQSVGTSLSSERISQFLRPPIVARFAIILALMTKVEVEEVLESSIPVGSVVAVAVAVVEEAVVVVTS